ncbi:hypothetical protein ACI65C_011739 [Semiaphis heraclei]
MASHVARCPVHGPATPVNGRGGAARRTCLCAEQLFMNNNKDSCDGDGAEGRVGFSICLVHNVLRLRFRPAAYAQGTTVLYTSSHSLIIRILRYWIYFPFFPTLLSRLTRVP